MEHRPVLFDVDSYNNFLMESFGCSRLSVYDSYSELHTIGFTPSPSEPEDISSAVVSRDKSTIWTSTMGGKMYKFSRFTESPITKKCVIQ